MSKIILLLDLDGVLITDAIWKVNEMDTDGYSKFNSQCIDNLNQLLTIANFEIWLSSARRLNMSLPEFREIFKHRKIAKDIKGFVPIYLHALTRKQEIESFIDEFQPKHYLIIDDDKSLHHLPTDIQKHWVKTRLMKGLDSERLQKAINIVSEMS